MEIGKILNLDAGVSGLAAQGQVTYALPAKNITGTGQNGDYSFWTQFIVLKDNTGEIGVNLNLGDDGSFAVVKGANINITKGVLEEYTDKKGAIRKTLKAKLLSSTPAKQPTPQQAYQQNMQQRLKPQTQQQPVSQTDKAIVDWEAKDLRMARMNALTNATSLVTTLAELMGKPEECTPASVKIIAMAFVDFVYGKAPKKPADMTTAELLDTPASVDDIPFGDEGNYEERN
jgi:hypothetical protein